MTMILKPDSNRWDEFCNKLSDALVDGCRHDHRHAKQVMDEMGDIDIAGSIAFFEANGGYCDCEILFNVQSEEEIEAEQKRAERAIELGKIYDGMTDDERRSAEQVVFWHLHKLEDNIEKPEAAVLQRLVCNMLREQMIRARHKANYQKLEQLRDNYLQRDDNGGDITLQ